MPERKERGPHTEWQAETTENSPTDANPFSSDIGFVGGKSESAEEIQTKIEAKKAQAELHALVHDFMSSEVMAPFLSESGAEYLNDYYARTENPGDLAPVKTFMESVTRELEQNPELQKRMVDVFVRNNREQLQKHSEQQLNHLRALEPRPSFWKRQERKEYAHKRQAFYDWIINANVQRSVTNKVRDEYLSPEKSGKFNSYGYTDPLVGASHYVYATLDALPHKMGSKADVSFDKASIQERSEIVTMDIADLRYRQPNRIAETYLDNCFDFETGMMILAEYFSQVFHSVEEAEDFFQQRPFDERIWDTQEVNIDRLREIQSAMKAIQAATNIEPPLNLEVRIRDRAVPISAQ